MSLAPASSALPASGSKKPQLIIRHPGLGDMQDALREGIADWRACHTEVPMLALLAPVAAIMLAAVVTAPMLMPFVFPVCAGFALLGPMATIWFAALSRAREEHGTASADSATAVFDTPRRITIQNLGLVAVGLYLLWVAVAAYIYFHTLGATGPAGGLGFFASVVTTAAGWKMTITGCIAGAVFAVIMLGIGLVSFPLALDRDVTTWQALTTAFRAMAQNPAVVFIWGALVAVMLALGTLPALLGLALVMPILGHSTWHMYRRLVG
jgi:uncharacterized membrane protein